MNKKDVWTLTPVFHLKGNESHLCWELETPERFETLEPIQVVPYHVAHQLKNDLRNSRREVKRIAQLTVNGKPERVIYCASSTLRFYLKHGWSKKTLSHFLSTGTIKLVKSHDNYFVLDENSKIDTKKLFAAFSIRVLRFEPAYDLTDEQYIDRYMERL